MSIRPLLHEYPESAATGPGGSSPLGATVVPGGVNFSVFSRDADGVELLLFDHADDAKPSVTVTLDPKVNRTYHYWHLFVPGIGEGQLYGYRITGTSDCRGGLRFDHDKLLLDPYGRALAVPEHYSRQAACMPGDNAALAMKSVVADPRRYDWEGDTSLKRPFSRTVIYELHVGGFTRHPSSGVPVEKRGTYAGLVEKIPYLRHLGITALELLPVFQFDWQDAPHTQHGNNNAYGQDNEMAWFDWRLLERHDDLTRFLRLLISERLQNDFAVDNLGLTLNQLLRQARLEWHGVRLGRPDWSHESHSIAVTAWSLTRHYAFQVMVNAWKEPLTFELPAMTPGCHWHRWIDTSMPSPSDITPMDEAPEVVTRTYELQPHSLAALVARGTAEQVIGDQD